MPGDVHVIRGRQRVTSELGRPLRAPAVAIGNFDGVHLGHQALVATARRLAHAAGGEAVVLTFDPHPARFFAPKLAPPMLLTLERRLELLAKAGADVVVVEPFTTDFAALPADRFIAEVLRGDLDARQVVVGRDFTFGAGRQGNATMLGSEGARLHMGGSIVAPVVGAGLSLLVAASAGTLALLLALFCGFFLFIGASDLLPEAQHRHPKLVTSLLTMLGALIIYMAIHVSRI